MDTKLTVNFEESKNLFRFIFSDGVIIEKEKAHFESINILKRKSVILSFNREDDKWNNYILWSNGEVEIIERKECECGLPKYKENFTPTEYEMYITLFEKWVAKGKFEYSDDNTFKLNEVVAQFDKKQWLEDVTYHKFECVQCNEELIISINTYRGGGSGFYRNKK